MVIPLQVLLVEDSEDDALLIIDLLEAGGYKTSWKRVDKRQCFEKALQTNNWDVILADYNLPSFDGLEALKILKESGLDLPFIIVSGAIGEETAVKAIKAGAHDYLLKNKLTRLVMTVSSEIRKAKERESLRQAEIMRCNLEKQLEQAKELAEEANRRKSQVLAFVAHELKNPLSSIILYGQMLEKGLAGKLNAEQAEFMKNIMVGSQNLDDLISDILDIATIEAGKVDLSPEIVNLNDLISEVKIVLSEIAKKKEIDLHFQTAQNLGQIKVDPKRLKQILTNLISNAIKYNEPGGYVDVQIHKSDDEQKMIYAVSDNGIGISEEELSKLFTEFYRVNSKDTKKEEGLGLGLALTKRLIELHGGNIWVKSQKGSGSVFTFELPIIYPD